MPQKKPILDFVSYLLEISRLFHGVPEGVVREWQRFAESDTILCKMWSKAKDFSSLCPGLGPTKILVQASQLIPKVKTFDAVDGLLINF